MTFWPIRRAASFPKSDSAKASAKSRAMASKKDWVEKISNCDRWPEHPRHCYLITTRDPPPPSHRSRLTVLLVPSAHPQLQPSP